MDEIKEVEKPPPCYNKLLIGVLIFLFIIGVLALIKFYPSMCKSGFMGKFSLWGTPDWEIRNKGHANQVRSDSDVSTPDVGSKWGMSEFKKSVRDLNRKAAAV